MNNQEMVSQSSTKKLHKKRSKFRNKTKRGSACVGLSLKDCVFPCKTVKKRRNMKSFGHCKTIFSKHRKYIDKKTGRVVNDKMRLLKKTALEADKDREASERNEKKSKQYAEKSVKKEEEAKKKEEKSTSIFKEISYALGFSKDAKPTSDKSENVDENVEKTESESQEEEKQSPDPMAEQAVDVDEQKTDVSSEEQPAEQAVEEQNQVLEEGEKPPETEPQPEEQKTEESLSEVNNETEPDKPVESEPENPNKPPQ